MFHCRLAKLAITHLNVFKDSCIDSVITQFTDVDNQDPGLWLYLTFTMSLSLTKEIKKIFFLKCTSKLWRRMTIFGSYLRSLRILITLYLIYSLPLFILYYFIHWVTNKVWSIFCCWSVGWAQGHHLSQVPSLYDRLS